MTAARVQQRELVCKYILNHDIMHCTADGVVGNYLYSGRALGISQPWDIIQMHEDLKPLLPAISRHYRNIGLGHTENIIWHIAQKELGAHIGYNPSVFFFGPDECRYWGDNRWLAAVEFVNSKNNFIVLARHLGVDIPYTLCFDKMSMVDLDKLSRLDYPCYLKAAVSVSGVGIYRCEDRQSLEVALSRFDSETPVQIQEEIIASVFLNLQYRVSGKRLERLAVSEQILEGFAHQGNRVPTHHQPWHSVEPMAQWLMEFGIKGIFAFDVAVVEGESGIRYQAIECNPRYNGASYPTLIAAKLGIREWSTMTFHTRHRSLSSIDLDDIEFNHAAGRGIVIVNWGTILSGKLVCLLAGSPEDQEGLRMELLSRL